VNMHMDSELERAFDALANHKYELARHCFESAVGRGAIDGAVHLGWLYERGLGGSADIVRAEEFYEIGRRVDAKLGSYYLGLLLKGKTKNDRAISLLEESAELGHPSAAYWAYVLNSEAGYTNRAQDYLTKAAKLQHLFARRDLARLKMRQANSVKDWFDALRDYYCAKAQGALIAIKDIEDMRIR
jgi:TPR repeat protein